MVDAQFKNIYRWANIREGCGGIVVADSLDEAKEKVEKFVSEHYQKTDTTQFEVEVWDAVLDDYMDENHPSVLECYGN